MCPVVAPVRPKPAKLRNFAEDWDWRGPRLPQVWGLALVPTDAGVMSATNYYACGPMGVYYDLGDNPMASQPMNSGFPKDAWVVAIVRDPNDPNGQTLYAGVRWKDSAGYQKADVFKTTDRNNWVALNMPGRGPLNQEGISAFAFVDPSHQPNTLYAVGDGGVWKTTDGGLNWVAVNSGLPNGATGRAIAIDPNNTQIHYVAAQWRDASGKEYYDVYKWSPGGPWQATGLGRIAFTLAVDANGWALYAGTDDGVYKYARQGGLQAWSHLTGTYPDAAIPQGSVEALVVDPSDYNTVFAGTQEGGVYWSSDGGQAWVAMNGQLTNFEVYSHLNATHVHALGLTVGPSGPNSTGKTLYAGIDGGVIRIQNV